MNATPLALVLSAIAGIIAGLFTGYNGFRKNRIDESANLVQNALHLVESLHAELARVQSENARLREAVTLIEQRVHELELINSELSKRLDTALAQTDRASSSVE